MGRDTYRSARTMSRRGSVLVGTGILLSRISGVIRSRVLAHFLGQGYAADILYEAWRIPNVLQNLLGEGALSASFIPTYSRLLGQGRDEEARRLAGAILSLLMATVAVMVLAGELTTPWLVYLLAPNWAIEKRQATEVLVRILFPGIGLLVISAWCLGILNSHRRFLLSYSVGVVLNGAMIAAVLLCRNQVGARIAIGAAWGAVVGSLLQIVVQWPVVLSVGGGIRLSAWRGIEDVATVVRTFIPNVISRGANQISAYIDLEIAGWLPVGTVAAMFNAQMIYTLPVSLFGMAVSASELPEMSREHGDPATVAQALRVRLDAATKRLAFYIVPSAAVFLCLGDVIAAAIYQTGKFTAHDSQYVWFILGGSAIGLLASTLGRLYASTFYALGDTKTPLYCGLVRVTLTGAFGWIAALVVPRMFGWPATWGAGGLTASAGVAGWVEFMLLRRGLFRQIGRFDLPKSELLKLWTSAVVAAALSTALRFSLPGLSPIPLAMVTLSANGFCYLGLALWWSVPEAAVLVGQIQRTLRR